MSYPKILLKPSKERSIYNFHPWIFSGAVAKKDEGLNDGDVVDVFSSDNKYLATGHYTNASITVRILTFEKKIIDIDFWNKKIASAFALRQSLGLISGNNNCFRLIHGEGDGLPGLIIDIYNTSAVIQCHSHGMNNAVDDIAKAIVYILPFIKTIYDKTEDKFFKRSSRFISGDKTDDIVTENGLKFYVNWVEGQKTGFFNDQRDNRKLLKGFCHRKRVLNLFSYSGGFSVYALQGEAEHVTSVDSSAKAQEWCEKNISLNPFSGSHKFQCSDVIEFLKSEKSIYNIIIVDPPAFAKHREAIDNASTGYRNLNYEAIKKIAKGGYIYTFSCSQVIDKELFRKIIFKAAAQSRRNIKIVHQLTQAPDHPVSIYHPEGEYLKGLVLYVE